MRVVRFDEDILDYLPDKEWRHSLVNGSEQCCSIQLELKTNLDR
jgi:hypothetical protein